MGFQIVFNLHVLMIFSNLNCLFSDEVHTNPENASDSYFNNEDLSRNESYDESLLNQTYDSTNETYNISTNFTTTNSSEPDLVVTEDSTEKPESPNPGKYLYFATSDEDICSCDLNSNYCDINCCCDSDCTEEDTKVFSKCQSRALVPDKNYCYQRDIILKNNTVYKMVRDPESSLFCIVHDNLKRHLRFGEMPVLKSHRDLDALLEYQSKFISSWSEDKEVEKPEWSGLKAGSPISIVNTKHETGDSFWNLPSACFTRMCSCHQEVRYLEDFRSACSRPISNHRDECATNAFLSAETYAHFCIPPHTDDTTLTTLIAHTAQPDRCTRIRTETPGLKPKFLHGFCFNVISGVYFVVSHNGFHGISDIIVKFDYINISQAENVFTQRFSVEFRWDNVTDTERRSGNPGYQIGFPILTGTNSSVMDEPFEITMQQIGLSVLDRDAEGRCNPKQRRVVKFGKNLKASCLAKFNAAKDCKSRQERIFDILLGSSHRQVFVGVFGNANGSNIDDWMEAYHEDRDVAQTDGTCILIKGLAINIAFAAVGTVVNPQYKILGVGYHYAKPEKVDLSSSSDLVLSTAVSFFDVTEPAMPHYPKVPSIKANIPSDFFYPFLYGKQMKFISNVYLVILMCIVILIR